MSAASIHPHLPPYGRDVATIDKPAWIAGGSLGAKDTRNYSNPTPGMPRETYRAMAEVARQRRRARPGGFLVVVTKNLRTNGALLTRRRHNRPCRTSGLLPATRAPRSDPRFAS